MSVAFPLGVGIALVLGVVNNYIVALQQGGHTGNVALLALGVALVVIAAIARVVHIVEKKHGQKVMEKELKRAAVLSRIVFIRCCGASLYRVIKRHQVVCAARL